MSEAGIQYMPADRDRVVSPDQKPHGEEFLYRMHTHLAHNLEALTNQVGEVIKNFGQIAATFALQHYRRDKELHVHQENAFGEVQQRIAHRQAKFLLFEKLAEFG